LPPNRAVETDVPDAARGSRRTLDILLTSEVEMPNSAYIAKLLGPALIGITVTEWMNLDIFTAAIGPSFATHVYLNGTLLFIAGLAIVRAHNVWSRRWPVLITLVG